MFQRAGRAIEHSLRSPKGRGGRRANTKHTEEEEKEGGKENTGGGDEIKHTGEERKERTHREGRRENHLARPQ